MSMDQTPTSPGSGRPRTRSRGLSYASNKSGGSDGSKQNVADKARRDSLWKGATKANPNAAINESQPGEANLIEQSTLQNLREYQHRDAYGNVIADPDLSNPTRPRLERPLDTIRSFEKAIDEGYKRRSTYIKQDANDQWDKDNQFASRRSSYFGGYDNGPSPNRHSQVGGYYGSQNGGPPPRMRYGSRMQSDPGFQGQGRPYPQHGYHQSGETVQTNGSDSTGPWANSTDPSSENSSLDRVNAMNKPQDAHGYNGQNGYNGPIMEEQGAGTYGAYPYQEGYGQQYPNGGGPRANFGRHNTAPGMGEARRPMQLNGPPAPAYMPSTKKAEPEKRKSWLSRKFSKKDRD